MNGLFAQSGEVRDVSQTEPVPYSGKKVFTLTHATDCGYDALSVSAAKLEQENF
jgi:hypothetical protein